MEENKAYFYLQRKLLSVCGLSLDEQSALYKLYPQTFSIVLIIYFSILLYDIVVNFDNFDILVDSIFHGLATIMVLCKMWVFTSKKHKLNSALSSLQKGVFLPNKERGGPMEEQWIGDCVKYSRILIMVGWILALLTISISAVASIVKRIINNNSEEWELPFGIFSLINPHRSPNFEIAWFCQSSLFSMLTLTYTAVDSFTMSVFAYICVQFQMLRNSINRIVPDDFDMTPYNKESNGSAYNNTFTFRRCKDYSERLKQNVLYHIAIMNVAEEFEETLNFLVLCYYIVVAVGLGCVMYHGSLYPPSDPRFQKDAAMGLAALFQLFLVSYFGNEVSLQSKMVSSACFEAKFFETDVRLQKSLSLVVVRSFKPTKFTVGKFADLTLDSYVALVKASFSYYMLLQRVRE